MVNKICLFIIIILFISCQSTIADNVNNWEIWHSLSIVHSLSEKNVVKFSQEWRFRGEDTEHYYNHTDAGLKYLFTDWFDLSANFRYINSKNSKGNWVVEKRPYLEGTLKYNILGFKLSSRNRFAYRIREFSNDFWRYRNKFTLSHSLKIDDFEISPYLSDEIYIENKGDNWYQPMLNRFTFGITQNFFKTLQINLFYHLQNTKSGKIWTDKNILGLYLKYVF